MSIASLAEPASPHPSPSATATRAVALIGHESVGKSALFRALTGHATGDEANVRGTTIACRRAALRGRRATVVIDTPGLRLAADTAATRLALEALDQADLVLLVARGTHAADEVETLLRGLALAGRRAVLALTFADKAPPAIHALAAHYRASLGVPVLVIDARQAAPARVAELLAALDAAAPLTARAEPPPESLRAATREPALTCFERPGLGPWLALAAVLLLFALPVWGAYVFAERCQPFVDATLIAPLVERLSTLPEWPRALLAGDYGVLTLGSYSFLWAFPVVALLGLAVALGEESGLKDRITAALDPWLRRVGLAGRDLVPVLTGFGCNVVAVQQTRACSACTRRSCVSLIAFGSACSYQIGATLSVFGAGGHGWLFAPYLVALFLVGALHTRIWHGGLARAAAEPLAQRAFLQWPRPRAVWWRLRGTLRQFFLQAMPIFLGICVVAALLAELGALAAFARSLTPAFGLLGLPGEAAPGVVFSLLRKDGLLVLNADHAALLGGLDAGAAFLLVWLASTTSACLVTLATVARELGPRAAAALAGRQLATALATTLALAALLRFL